MVRKSRIFRKDLPELGISSYECLVVGDGANDLNMMSQAGVAVGYHPKPILIEKTHGAIFDDHRTLLDIIG